MKEQLIKFETAKLAKEKGFDWEVIDGFTLEGKPIPFANFGYYNWNEEIRDISQSTQSLLQKWLREIHDIHLLNSFQFEQHVFRVVTNIAFSNPINTHRYSSYEEALEIALKIALKLI